jgi:hypothetical protein
MRYDMIKDIDRKINKSNVVLKDIEKETNKKIKKKESLLKLNKRIKTFWFEEYAWFYTFDNFLVVVGKNATQNETLVKKYLDKYDKYIHSTADGCGSCIIKNPSNIIVPIGTIIEAGVFVIAHTKSWTTSIINYPYWTNADQVSKTPNSGEYVSKGSFIIRNKKNMIPIPKLELGLGYYFKNKSSDVLEYEGREDVEYSMLMCGSYKSVNNFKYKVKITPGVAKIGKSIRKLIPFIKLKMNLYEKSAINNISNDEYHKVLVNHLSIKL